MGRVKSWRVTPSDIDSDDSDEITISANGATATAGSGRPSSAKGKSASWAAPANGSLRRSASELSEERERERERDRKVFELSDSSVERTRKRSDDRSDYREGRYRDDRDDSRRSSRPQSREDSRRAPPPDSESEYERDRRDWDRPSDRRDDRRDSRRDSRDDRRGSRDDRRDDRRDSRDDRRDSSRRRWSDSESDYARDRDRERDRNRDRDRSSSRGSNRPPPFDSDSELDSRPPPPRRLDPLDSWAQRENKRGSRDLDAPANNGNGGEGERHVGFDLGSEVRRASPEDKRNRRQSAMSDSSLSEREPAPRGGRHTVDESADERLISDYESSVTSTRKGGAQSDVEPSPMPDPQRRRVSFGEPDDQKLISDYESENQSPPKSGAPPSWLASDNSDSDSDSDAGASSTRKDAEPEPEHRPNPLQIVDQPTRKDSNDSDSTSDSDSSSDESSGSGKRDSADRSARQRGKRSKKSPKSPANGRTAYCDLCDLRMMPSQLQEHYSGKKHQARQRKAGTRDEQSRRSDSADSGELERLPVSRQLDTVEGIDSLEVGDVLGFEEGRHIEFKGMQTTVKNHEVVSRSPYFAEYVSKYVTAFLNSDGGAILFGILDNGKVAGVPADRSERDHILRVVDEVVSRMRPMVDPTLFSVRFITVTGGDDALSVICIDVKPGPEATLFFTGTDELFVRRDGGVTRIKPSQIGDLIQQRTADARRGSKEDKHVLYTQLDELQKRIKTLEEENTALKEQTHQPKSCTCTIL